MYRPPTPLVRERDLPDSPAPSQRTSRSRPKNSAPPLTRRPLYGTVCGFFLAFAIGSNDMCVFCELPVCDFRLGVSSGRKTDREALPQIPIAPTTPHTTPQTSANTFGTIVGSKTLTLRQATAVAGIFQFSGALLAGSCVSMLKLGQGIADSAF